MFLPREIIYGYINSLYDPHNKYLIVLYQSEDLSILACFTTSQSRAGVSEESIHHGAIYRNHECVSFVFEKGKCVGKTLDGKDYSFPKRSIVTFDYGIKEGSKVSFFEEIENPKVVGVLNEEEYINLVYAMYRSPYTSIRHKRVLDTILTDYYKDK